MKYHIKFINNILFLISLVYYIRFNKTNPRFNILIRDSIEEIRPMLKLPLDLTHEYSSENIYDIPQDVQEHSPFVQKFLEVSHFYLNHIYEFYSPISCFSLSVDECSFYSPLYPYRDFMNDFSNEGLNCHIHNNK